MTKEEAKIVFLNRGYVEVEGGTIYDANKWRKSCRVISEWLEQEPSSDCISRQETIDTIRQLYIDLAIQKYVIDILKALPSVKPQPCEDAISRQAVLDSIERMKPYQQDADDIMEMIQNFPPVKPQESCDVPDTNVGDIISKQTVLDTISELNAISFYEAQEDSKECYYEIRQAIKDLSPVKPQEPKIEKVIKMRDATPEEQKSVNDYIKSISNPTGIEFDIDIDKKVESYGKLLKHPVVKHIMGMDETQEQLDFVQPHKKIPVTLTVQKEKTCDGCLFQQYPRITVCQECSRYYSDNYVKE